MPAKPFDVSPRALAAAAIALLFVGNGYLRSRPPAVAVAHPQVQEVTQSVSASGTVAGRDESDVAAEVGGRVGVLLVKEGERVRKGQVLARLETALLRSQLEQAEAALSTAQAQLVQAERGPLPSEIERVQAEVEQGRAVAQAQLKNARDRLVELERGPTREEIEQARGLAGQALAQLQQSQREAKRMRQLYEDGAVTRQEYERAETQAKVAQDGYRTNYNRFRQQRIGTRAEVIAQGRAQLRQAEANLRGAQETGAARLRNLQEQPRPEDVQVARTRLEEARRNFDVARQKLRQAEVLAPYDGVVTRLFLKPGQLTGANAPLLHLVRGGAFEIQVNVDENNLGRLAVGQQAQVSCDAYPESFQARLREVAPQVISERGTVQLKLDPQSPPAWLRPGQTVSVNVIFEQGKKLPIVPLTAVTIAGRRSTVLLLKDGKLEEREVRLGAPGRTGFPINEGVSESDWVVQNRTSLQSGQRARAL